MPKVFKLLSSSELWALLKPKEQERQDEISLLESRSYFGKLTKKENQRFKRLKSKQTKTEKQYRETNRPTRGIV